MAVGVGEVLAKDGEDRGELGLENDGLALVGDREERGVSVALRRMQRDMSMLDQAAGSTPQLSNVELVLLSSAVVTAFCAPLAVAESVVEVLVPSCAALAAAIGGARMANTWKVHLEAREASRCVMMVTR